MERPFLNEEDFYKLLSEIYSRVSDHSCGCIDRRYKPASIEKRDKYISSCEPIDLDADGKPVYSWTRSDHYLDYIGNIIRRYMLIIK